RALAFFDVLLAGAAVVVEGNDALGRPRQVGDDEADARIKLAGVPLDLGHHSSGLCPCAGLVAISLKKSKIEPDENSPNCNPMEHRRSTLSQTGCGPRTLPNRQIGWSQGAAARCERNGTPVGCLRSLRAHVALDGVSWVQSGSVEIAVGQ